jgi:uncharacterized cupredoxin-like copper-binding protein
MLVRAVIAGAAGVASAVLLNTVYIPFVGAVNSRFAAPRVVTITASEYAFDAPDTLQAGNVTFQLLNRGKEMHHIWLVRLAQGKTAKDFNAAFQADPMKLLAATPWVVHVGGPNSPVPGGKSEATVNLAPGNYMILCLIPSSDGKPHVMKGMMRSLTVEAPKRGRAPDAELRADVVMKLVDYDFQLSARLKAGRRTIRIENAAPQPHEAFMVRLLPGRKASDLLEWVGNGQQGAPPAIPVGGITGLSKGQHIYITMNLEPGSYALYCFVPDAKDGKEHIAHGMVKEIQVEGAAVSTAAAREGSTR